MNRDEFAWLTVRAVGVILLAFTILEALNLLLIFLQAALLRSELMSGSVGEDDVVTQAAVYRRLVRSVWSSAFELAVVGFCSYYCLYRGTWVYKLLIRRLPSIEQ